MADGPGASKEAFTDPHLYPVTLALAGPFCWTKIESRVRSNFPEEPPWARPRMSINHPPGSRGRLSWASMPLMFQKTVKYSPKLVYSICWMLSVRKTQFFLRWILERERYTCRSKTNAGEEKLVEGSREQFPERAMSLDSMLKSPILSHVNFNACP